MDDLTRAFYRVKFREAFLGYEGQAFQDWFCRLAEFAFGSDFDQIRPYGAEGDHKADGRTRSDGTIYQCYAPQTVKASRLAAKIREDFAGARVHWSNWMKRWVFVHNDRRGLPVRVAKELDALRETHSAITIETWSEAALTRLFDRLDTSGLESLFGVAPRRFDRATVAPEDVDEIIRRLGTAEAVPRHGPIRAPSVDKIDKNALSEHVVVLLRAGKSYDHVIRQFFERHPVPDTGERIASGFRRRYQELRDSDESPDDIFIYLQQYMGAGESAKSQIAALAVLSYLFDRCDIFEDPNESAEPT